ncbi:NUMOD3 motif (2 copies) [compost metagenome]
MWAYTRTVNSHKGILTSREVEMAKIAKAKVMSERVVSDETREKIRKTLTGHKIPQEVIEKRRKKQIGQKRSDETKQKLSEKRQELIANGWTMPEDAREKIGNAARGRKMSDEAKEKISEFNKGKVIPETTRKALSEYQKALRPWEKSSCKARFARKKVWLEASESYGIWKENGEPKGWAFSSILSKLHEVEYKKYHFDKMLEMFSDGWIPNEDNDWLKFKEMYEQS